MGLYGALRGITATARIVRGAQLTGTAIKIKRKADKARSSVERYMRRNSVINTSKKDENFQDRFRFSDSTMAGRYIARILKQSRG